MAAGDVLKERPQLFLASRLRRLADRMQADVAVLAQQEGLKIQPSQYALLATLDLYGPRTIGELTQAMEISQPAITRTAAKLSEMGLVAIERLHKDQRHKTVSLTAAGRSDMERSKGSLWPQIEAAVDEVLFGLNGPLLDQIDQIEALIEETPLRRRAQDRRRHDLRIHEFTDDLAPAFRDINAQWIGSMYRLEQTDIDVLENPRARIIEKGGAILFVEAVGLGIVGACALQKTGEDQYELTKMGVLESARGRKAGEFLLKAIIARAERLGARRLYLLSNKKSAAAVHLYEKNGFRHDEGIMAAFGARYERCDVAMLHHPNTDLEPS